MTPVIDEETGYAQSTDLWETMAYDHLFTDGFSCSDPSMLDDQYSLYSMKIPTGPRPAVRGPPYESARSVEGFLICFFENMIFMCD